MKNSMEVSQKIKNRATIWPSIPSSEYMCKGNEISISQRHLHSHFHCSIIYNSQNIEKILKQFKCLSTDELIKKTWYMYIFSICIYTHIQNGILFSLKKENPVICNNLNKPGGHYAKWNKSQTQKIKYCMTSFICVDKNVIPIEPESRLVFTRDWRGKELGKYWSRVQSFSYARWVNSGNLTPANTSQNLHPTKMTWEVWKYFLTLCCPIEIWVT